MKVFHITEVELKLLLRDSLLVLILEYIHK